MELLAGFQSLESKAQSPSATALTEQQDSEGLVVARLGMGAAILKTSFLQFLPTV